MPDRPVFAIEPLTLTLAPTLTLTLTLAPTLTLTFTTAPTLAPTLTLTLTLAPAVYPNLHHSYDDFFGAADEAAEG